MNVAQLIDELTQYNPDAEVTREDSETVFLSFIGETKEDAKFVFVEKRDYVDDRFDNND